jgi:hypothetical protein
MDTTWKQLRTENYDGEYRREKWIHLIEMKNWTAILAAGSFNGRCTLREGE